jgi:predicted O-linked N-acetylglucosamine transferase (SPINDLY family)
MTPRFKAHCDAFHQIGDDLERAAARILADELHILVYTDIGMNALATELAALRLAPVQCKGWGHPVTTGLPTIDFYLSSDLMEPADAREHYSETLIRLPNLALAYSPPARPRQTKSRRDFGLPEDAFVCLSPQSLFKYLPQHDDIYPRIALEVPDARFIFLAHDNPEVTKQFSERLTRAFDACRLDFSTYCRILPRQNFQDFLSLNIACDVLLDTFDWSGGKTTLEAISCDLPVVTCPGRMMRGRHAYAMLVRMGITELIAKDKRDYAGIVARLRRDSRFYAQMKTRISEHRTRLYADRSCIRALEDFYRQIAHSSFG